jgi:hypothetical protein
MTKPRVYEDPFMNNCGHNVPDDEKTSYLAKL